MKIFEMYAQKKITVLAVVEITKLFQNGTTTV
jgi:hypothetical protein